MRGYDALVLVDVSRQGGEPGTLYVMEPDPEEIEPIDDGEVDQPARDGPEDGAALRQDGRRLAGQGRDRRLRAGGRSRRWGWSSRRRSPARSSAPPTSWSRRSPSCAPTDAGLDGGAGDARALVSSAVVDTALRHAAGRRVTPVDVTVGALRQVVPDSLDFYFEIVARDTLCEGAALELEIVAGADALPRVRARVGPGAAAGRRPRVRRLLLPQFRCPSAGRGAEVVRGDELEVESIEVEADEGGGDASHQGQGRRGRARREHDDRQREPRTTSTAPGSRVVNLMSAPGAGKTTLLERALADLDDVRVGVLEGDVQGSSTPTGSRPCTSRSSSSTPSPASAASATSTPTWSARRSPTCRSTRSTCW